MINVGIVEGVMMDNKFVLLRIKGGRFVIVGIFWVYVLIDF